MTFRATTRSNHQACHEAKAQIDQVADCLSGPTEGAAVPRFEEQLDREPGSCAGQLSAAAGERAPGLDSAGAAWTINGRGLSSR